MSDWYASGRMVDVILVLMVVEGLGLVAWRRATGRGVASLDLLVNFAAGGCLLLALRSALKQESWPFVALWLTGALVAHVADLARRWRGN